MATLPPRHGGELDELRKAVRASSDAEAKARLAAQQAEEERERLADQVAAEAEQRLFWEQFAAEAQRALNDAEKSLKAIQTEAEKVEPKQLDLLAQLAARMADEVEIDEATTRVLIDEHLRSVGWEVDSTEDCQEFRVRAGIMGEKEAHYVPTQRACDTD